MRQVGRLLLLVALSLSLSCGGATTPPPEPEPTAAQRFAELRAEVSQLRARVYGMCNPNDGTAEHQMAKASLADQERLIVYYDSKLDELESNAMGARTTADELAMDLDTLKEQIRRSSTRVVLLEDSRCPQRSRPAEP